MLRALAWIALAVYPFALLSVMASQLLQEDGEPLAGLITMLIVFGAIPLVYWFYVLILGSVASIGVLCDAEVRS